MFERLIRPTLATGTKSVLLLGARQVGKSTLLATLAPDRTINLASPATYRELVAHPEQLERELRAASPAVRTVLLDEVQRVPALLDVVQVLVDEQPRRFRFLLSGSSARKLRRGHANLLPGRMHVHRLDPLVARELGDQLDLDRMMAHGTLPGIYATADAAERDATLRSYVDGYLREEVQAEALVRDVGGYARLLDAVAASSGRILNLNALAQDVGVRYETARRYLEVLEDTLLAFRVPAWSGSDRGSLVQHPRVYLFDLGVRNALLRRPLDAPLPDERGLLLEHLVAYELERRRGSLRPDARLSYFRTRNGAEVDFVFEVGRERWAIEVKASRTLRAEPMRGLRALGERVGKVHRALVVYLGDRRQAFDGYEAIPFRELALEL